MATQLSLLDPADPAVCRSAGDRRRRSSVVSGAAHGAARRRAVALAAGPGAVGGPTAPARLLLPPAPQTESLPPAPQTASLGPSAVSLGPARPGRPGPSGVGWKLDGRTRAVGLAGVAAAREALAAASRRGTSAA